MDNETSYGDNLLPLTTDNFPFKDRGEPVLDWMREAQPYQIAYAARADGYDCSNMRHPEKSLEFMNFAMAEESEWRDLPLEAVRFWKIFYHKWRFWQFQGRSK